MFYVFHGDDEFSRAETLEELRARLGPRDTLELNTTRLGATATLSELRNACDAIPFLADRRLVVVEGMLAQFSPRRDQPRGAAQDKALQQLLDYLPRVPDSTRLVFVEPAVLPKSHPVLKLAQQDDQGYVKEFARPDASRLPRWIEQRVQGYQSSITSDAVEQLAAVIQGDLRLLDQELLKLATYAGPGGTISTEHVNLLVPYAKEAVIWDMVDALGRRDARTASRTLQRLLAEIDSDSERLGLLGMVVRQFRLLLQVKALIAEGATSQDTAKALGIHPFPAGKLHAQAANFTPTQLSTIYHHLLDTDVAVKTGKMPVDLALDLLVAGIAG